MADRYAGGELVAEVTRSGLVEGYHRGSVIVLDAAGGLVALAGDATGSVLPRSAVKPMQAAAMLRAGLRLDDPADLAIVAGSHHGEPFHVARVRALLHRFGHSEADLRCPPALPLSVAAGRDLLRAGGEPAPVFMNCSGKHAGMLATALASGAPTDGYCDPAHPVQVSIMATIADLAGEPVAGVGVDGCGAPTPAFSLAGLARAYLSLVAAAPGTPERRVADAMRAHPEMVAGTGADDTRLLAGLPGALAKGGAEGVIAVAVPDRGAVAIKIDDGARRARFPVLASALRRLDLDAPVLAELGVDADGVRQLGGGRPVGTVRSLW